MKHLKKELSLRNCIKIFINLDCRSLPVQVNGTASTVGVQRPKIGKIANIASIRTLLVFFGSLQSQLQLILDFKDLSQFYEARKLLVEKVIPDSVFAFEFCRSMLAMKGATDSPIATKLASIANNVGDIIELLKARIGISMEYHELKYNVIGDIRDFVMKQEFSMVDADPLMYSLNVSLPSRLESFASHASQHHSESVDELFRLSIEVTEQARFKVDKLRSQEAIIANKQKPPILEVIKEKSPLRPKLQVLRGVKVRQPLKQIHRRVPSLKNQEIQRELFKIDLDQNKENISASDKVHESEKRGGRSSEIDSSGNASLKKTSYSRLKPPTKVENRKLVSSCFQSRKNSGDFSHSASFTSYQPSTPSTSKISRPTVIKSRRSNSHFNDSLTHSDTPRRICSFSTPLSKFSKPKVNLRFPSYRPQCLKMQLASPGLAFEETPLTRKHVPGHNGQSFVSSLSHTDLQVNRMRPLNNSLS